MNFLLTLGLLLGAHADDCALCPRLAEMEERMKSIPVYSPNEADNRRADDLLSDGVAAVHEGLREENFNRASAVPLVRFMAHLSPYDGQLAMVQADRPAFLRLWNQPESLLQEALKQLPESERNRVLDDFRPVKPPRKKKSADAQTDGGLSPCQLGPCAQPHKMRLPESNE